MTAPIPATEPLTLVRGDSTVWTRGFGDYVPNDGWTLTYHFISAAGKVVVTCTNNGDATFLATITKTISKQFVGPAGFWDWQAIVANVALTQQITLARGRLQVAVGFAEQNNGADVRSQLRQTLDAVNATLLGRASSDQMQVTYNGRSIMRLTVKELLAWRAQLQQEVAVEDGEDTGAGRQVRVAYGTI